MWYVDTVKDIPKMYLWGHGDLDELILMSEFIQFSLRRKPLVVAVTGIHAYVCLTVCLTLIYASKSVIYTIRQCYEAPDRNKLSQLKMLFLQSAVIFGKYCTLATPQLWTAVKKTNGLHSQVCHGPRVLSFCERFRILIWFALFITFLHLPVVSVFMVKQYLACSLLCSLLFWCRLWISVFQHLL